MSKNWMRSLWRGWPMLVLMGVLHDGVEPAFAAATDSDETGVQDVDLSATSLVTNLELLAKQFGLELVYDADQLKGRSSPALHGRMTAMEAVRRALQGQNLKLIEHPDGAILVTPPPADVSGPDSNTSSRQPDAAPAEQLPGGADAQGADEARRETVLNKIVVTGTHIVGETPVGSSLSVHARDEIERSGSATLDQYGRKMTENYSGADPGATSNTNANIGIFEQGAASNVFQGAGFNLKGLGPGATLTLLNGHRLAPGGLDGATVDVSQIPLSAIDHIEVLDDGASAIYGSDAVAGVVNIITRHGFDGAETGLRHGRATQGGAVETTASQIVGRDWDGGNAMAVYEYDDQGGLDASQRSWIEPQGGPYSLIPENRRHSAYITGRQDIAGGSTLSADLLYSERHFQSNGIQNAADPLVDNLQRSAGEAAQSSLVVSVSHDVGNAWSVIATGNYSGVRQTDNSTAEVGGGAVDGTPMQHLEEDSAIASLDVLLTGSLLDLRGGPLKASLGLADRWEYFHSELSSDTLGLLRSGRRTVPSIYGELIAPLIEGGMPGSRRLELSAAFRVEDYEGFPRTRNPKFGWLWGPVDSVQIKGTVGTSFKAPLLSQLHEPLTSYTELFPSLGSSGKDDVLIINGGNMGLHAESATSVTLGADFEPARIEGLSASFNYFWLRFDNRIQEQNILPQPILSQPQLEFITSSISQAIPAQNYFQDPGFLGDGAGLGPAGVDLIVSNEFANTASTLERGLSVSSRYRWMAGSENFEAALAGQYLLTDLIRTATFAPQQSVANTIGEPPKFKGRGDVSWSTGPWLADAAVNYVNAYRNTLFSPSQSIDSWTTVDAYVAYSTPSGAPHCLGNIQVGWSAQNVFDRRPPFVAIPSAYLVGDRNAIPFDGANASPVGRQFALLFKKRW